MFFSCIKLRILRCSSGQEICNSCISNLKLGTRSTENLILVSGLFIPSTLRMTGNPMALVTLENQFVRGVKGFRITIYIYFYSNLYSLLPTRTLEFSSVIARSTAVLRTLNISLGERMVLFWRSFFRSFLQAGVVLRLLLPIVAKFGIL